MVKAYNFALNAEVEVEAGFLIVKSFPCLYIDYRQRYNLFTTVYAIPRLDREPADSPIQYRGIDRDALDEGEKSELSAEVFLAILELEARSVNGIIFTEEDARFIFHELGTFGENYELIWHREVKSSQSPPDGFISAGFEPTYFVDGHFSPLCDCMMFPRWHGTDQEGMLFQPYFQQLNQWGLFNTPEIARSFLDFYCSFDWTETGEYVTAEVFIQQSLA